MNKYFLYVGTRIIGSDERLWPEPLVAPFGGRWLDAANLALTKYLPGEAKDWGLLLNTVADHDSRANGNRTFELYKSAVSPVSRLKVNSGSTPSQVGLVKKEAFQPANLVTTSIMQGDLIAKAEKLGMPRKLRLGTRDTGNNSGHATKDELDAVCAKFLEGLEFPAFTVTDCNTFHTSGYLWAKVALDAAMKKDGAGAVLIVNFDQHQDYEAPKDLVKSDGWGKTLLRNYQGAFINFGCNGITDRALDAEAFLLATCSTKGSEPQKVNLNYGDKITTNHLVNLKTATRYDQVVPDLPILRERIPVMLDKLQEQMGTQFKYCFVTVDRDCMLNNGTQWGTTEPAFWSFTNLRQVMEIVMLYLRDRKIELTGLDITGLPEVPWTNNPLRPGIADKIRDIPPILTGEAMMTAVKQELAGFEALIKVYEDGVSLVNSTSVTDVVSQPSVVPAETLAKRSLPPDSPKLSPLGEWSLAKPKVEPTELNPKVPPQEAPQHVGGQLRRLEVNPKTTLNGCQATPRRTFCVGPGRHGQKCSTCSNL